MQEHQSDGESRLKNGLYRSEESGHYFVVDTKPLRVFCITCLQGIRRDSFPLSSDFEVAARLFVALHGYLDEFVSDSPDALRKTFVADSSDALRKTPNT